jgi:hypothetical protein
MLPATVSLIAGTLGIEIAKFVLQKPIAQHLNWSINQARPILQVKEPDEPILTVDEEYDPIMLSPTKALPQSRCSLTQGSASGKKLTFKVP